MSNPYSTIADHCFWSRSMTTPAPGHVDPVTRSTVIKHSDKVSTMGSCFAQHLSRHIRSSGLNYFVAESAPSSFSDAQATAHNYGIFSARYGNIYTVRQAIQLFDRAYGTFVPEDAVWQKADRYVDAFRPQIEPDGYPTVEAVRAAASEHLRHVRTIFEESDWLVFTLGLTETWRSKLDGAVYPIVPGAAGGVYDADKYEFINFTANEVKQDLLLLIEKLRTVNPRLKILLTVSPVPLIATYENRHVWVSTTVSKAALRVAADEVERALPEIYYFPSYEVITSPASGGRYYADNLREVTTSGVKHVMRLFAKHFFGNYHEETSQQQKITFEKNYSDVVCDEEVVEKSLRRSGF